MKVGSLVKMGERDYFCSMKNGQLGIVSEELNSCFCIEGFGSEFFAKTRFVEPTFKEKLIYNLKNFNVKRK